MRIAAERDRAEVERVRSLRRNGGRERSVDKWDACGAFAALQGVGRLKRPRYPIPRADAITDSPAARTYEDMDLYFAHALSEWLKRQ